MLSAAPTGTFYRISTSFFSGVLLVTLYNELLTVVIYIAFDLGVWLDCWVSVKFICNTIAWKRLSITTTITTMTAEACNTDGIYRNITSRNVKRQSIPKVTFWLVNYSLDRVNKTRSSVFCLPPFRS